jgi:hypothetical protein
VEAAFSAVNADSTGFVAPGRYTENSIQTQPDPGTNPPPSYVGKNASARGEGLGVGLGDSVPDEARSVLDETQSFATAPPNYSESHEDGPVPGDPLIYAALLHSDAIANWANSTCLSTAQAPIAYSRGYAANVELIDAGSANADGSMGAPVVATNDIDPARNAVTTWSEVYAAPNGSTAGGTPHYGLVSEVHQTYAPIDIAQDPVTGGAIEIEVLGEWFVRTSVDGINPPTMTYGVTDPATGLPMAPTDTVIRIDPLGVAISLQDITGSTGLEIPLDPLANIMLGEDFRAISAPDGAADPTSSPTKTPTRVAGAMDVARVNVLKDAGGVGTHIADLRIGHFESDLQVPAGGFTCPAAAPTTTTAAPTSSTAAPSTTSSTAPTSTTSTTAAPTSTTSTTAAPTSTTSTTAAAGPTPTTAPPTTTTSTTLPTRAEAATAVRAQPRTVG